MYPVFRLLLLLPVAILAACGQTGALYLPDEGVETPVEVRGGTAPEPEDEDGDQPQGR